MSEPNAPGVQPASTEPPTAPPEKRKGVPWWVLALLLGGCLVITVPNLIEARRAPGENAPVGHLRTLATAQAL